MPDRSWDLRGILHPADNRPMMLVLTAIAVPTWVGLLVFAGLFLDTAWDATPALLPPAIGPICVAASFWLTLPAQWGSFFSIRQRETCQAGELPPLNALVRAFLVELRILLFCGYVLAFFTLFLDASGPSRRAPLSEAQQHGVRWSIRKATRDNGASSSKRVGSQRGLSRKLIKLLNSVVSTRSYGACPKNETSRFFLFFSAHWPSATVR